MTIFRKAPRRLFAAPMLMSGLLMGGLYLCAAPSGALAADASQAGTVHTLTPEEKAQIEADAYKREMRAAGLANEGLADEDGERRIHGEASIMAGSGGARGLATSMVAPVGKNATVGASVVYQRDRYDYGPYGYGPYGYSPYGYERGSFGASDHYGHLERVERMERYRDWRAGRP